MQIYVLQRPLPRNPRLPQQQPKMQTLMRMSQGRIQMTKSESKFLQNQNFKISKRSIILTYQNGFFADVEKFRELLSIFENKI